jgi:hypothetical protein
MMATSIYPSPTKSSTKVATFRETHVDANASVQRLSFIPSSIIFFFCDLNGTSPKARETDRDPQTRPWLTQPPAA